MGIPGRAWLLTAVQVAVVYAAARAFAVVGGSEFPTEVGVGCAGVCGSICLVYMRSMWEGIR